MFSEGFYIILTIILCCVGIIQQVHLYNVLKKSKSVNGIDLGSNFETVCFIGDTNTRIILDKTTGILYIANDVGITHLIDRNGKPMKYKGFEFIYDRKEDN